MRLLEQEFPENSPLMPTPGQPGAPARRCAYAPGAPPLLRLALLAVPILVSKLKNSVWKPHFKRDLPPLGRFALPC